MKGSRPQNDFAYPNPDGTCPTNFQHPVVHLEERIHLLTSGAGWGDPSSCIGDTGLDWNSSRNAENSLVQSPGPDRDGEVPSDATVQVSPRVFGPYQCPTNVTAPDPSPGATTLSFACSHSGDPNCNIALSTPTSCAGGTCYVGAYNPTAKSYGWETLHADYWQTWQEASNNNGNLDNTLVSGVLTDGVSSDAGTFGDVVEDCVTDGGKCTPAFIVTSQNSPPQVYKTSGNP